MLAYTVNSVPSERGLRLSYEGAVDVTLFDEPQLFRINLVGSNGSPAFTEHSLVDILAQVDLPSTKELPGDRFFPSLELWISSLAISSESHTPLL